MSRMEPAAAETPALPPLYHDGSFWGMTATQFLGAFNDNLFKQFVLLTATLSAVGSGTADRQAMAMAAFALPFVLFSGFGGFLADRYSKRTIIVLCKVAEIAVMSAAAVVLFYGSQLSLLILLLFFMGTQSAFFGPAKYGILPEMFAGRDLPRANGVIQLTTFLAIIFGTAAAGFVKTDIAGNEWLAGVACSLIAIIGTGTSLVIRRQSAARPDLAFTASALVVRRDTVQMLIGDRPLLRVLSVSCLFWFAGGLVLPAVNAVGLRQLNLDEQTSFELTSMLQACLGVGIALGCVVAGRLSHGKVAFRLSRAGCCGAVVCAVGIWALGLAGERLLNFYTALGLLTLLGFCAGLFAVPLQVFLQSRPPAGQKGRMMGAMNLLNWIGILLSTAFYELCVMASARFAWPPSVTFLVVAAFLSLALWLVPRQDEPLG